MRSISTESLIFWRSRRSKIAPGRRRRRDGESEGRLAQHRPVRVRAELLDGEGLKHLANLPKLAQLTISNSGSDFSDDCLAALATLGQLKQLTILVPGDDPFSPAEISALKKSLPACLIHYEPNTPP